MRHWSSINLGKRTVQEDGFWISEDQKLFVVCDGVGGNGNGDMASKIVLEYIAKKYSRINVPLDEEGIENLILKADKKLRKNVLLNPDLIGMATTIALVYFFDNTAIIQHVGDSRVLFIDGEQLDWWSTKDHSEVQEMYSIGLLGSEAEMKMHEHKNRITRFLTSSERKEDLKISKSKINNVKKGDLFLLNTDGALENHTNKELVTIFSEGSDKLEINWEIFINICKLDSTDNNTSILIEI